MADKQKPDSMMNLQELMARQDAKEALEAEQSKAFNKMKHALAPAGELKKEFKAVASRKDLNAAPALNKEDYDANAVVYKTETGVVMQKTPLTKEQLEDAKFVYKPVAGIPTAKTYEGYKAAHPDEKISPPPGLSADEKMLAGFAAGYARVAEVEKHRAEVTAIADKAIETNRTANHPKVTPPAPARPH